QCGAGGAPSPAEIARRITTRTGRRILGGWGMTETSPVGTNIPPGRPDKIGTIGVPLPGIYMDVASPDDPTRVLPAGEIGEIRIFGDRKSTRLNSSHVKISYAVFCLKKKTGLTRICMTTKASWYLPTTALLRW